MWNLPNILTLMRIAMIPVFIVVYYLPWEWHHFASAAIFGIAALTDWVDGYFARKLNMVTPFGAFLDPVADKLIVVAALVLLIEVHSSPWFSLPAIIIIGRELVISALREWMSELGSGQSIAVSTLGKVKTWFQMPEQEALTMIGFIAIYAAAALTLWSMIYYLIKAWPQLSTSGDK
jgi:CDP-diacylglycerol--glycerol-3-phosphate 3-phosphatidyltransferase